MRYRSCDFDCKPNFIEVVDRTMSLDLFLSHPACPTCNHQPDRLEFNCTYNLSKMWYTIYPDDTQMVPIDGMTGEEAKEKLLYAIDWSRKHERKLKALEPTNCWGTYEGFMKFLIDVYTACLTHPECVWGSWR